ncbi:unnamed protein product [Camellia sinensis]
MIFIMIYVSFDMIIDAYLLGNMAALIVKGSKTERFRDKMADFIKYMNTHKLGKPLSNEIKDHVRLQYENRYTEAAALHDIPISIRAKIRQTDCTDLGAAMVNLETGVQSWVFRCKNNILSLQLDHSEMKSQCDEKKSDCIF